MPTRARSGLWWLAALLVAGIGILLLVMAPERSEAPVAPVPAQRPVPAEIASPFGSTGAVLGPDAVVLPTQPLAPPSSSLPGLSYTELMDVKQTLAQGPDPGGDFKRSADSMIFKDALQRLRQLSQEDGDKAEMQALARMIEEAIQQQQSLGDIGASEARLAKALVLTVLEPDPARRRSTYARWLSQQQAHATAAATASNSTRNTPAHP